MHQFKKQPPKRPTHGNPIEIPSLSTYAISTATVSNPKEEEPAQLKQKVILRIKRKRGDLPYDNLVVDDLEKIGLRKPSKIFNRVNTVEVEQPTISLQDKDKAPMPGLRTNILKALSKEQERPIVKANPNILSLDSEENTRLLRERKITEMIKQRTESSRAARFQISNKNRLMPDSEDESDDELNDDNSLKHRTIALYDAVEESDDISDITCNLQQLFRKKLIIDKVLEDAAQDDYVYDIYEIDEGGHPFIPAEPATLAWVDFSDSESEIKADDSQSSYGESDNDSNAEDYFANDYPEEEDLGSEGYNTYAYDSDQGVIYLQLSLTF
ncbi:hypothetical protein DSO57_1019278 [Entomophthora muscae]|uniref:Uncharacterized protein n=1 Tax=Entomophthora muscae TaxID=34485 RepID=A0ACC2RIV8_9FUNG|nr:hypothetical protein DSO57_1019278 [Entomophthora muscae]